MTGSDERIAALVEVAYRAANMHGSSVEIAELKQLLPEGSDHPNLESAFVELPGLRERFELRNGKVVMKGEVLHQDSAESRRKARALANIAEARKLVGRLGGREAAAIAVSGSTSYMSAGDGDDIDLFCITKSGRMWVFVTKALILSRALRLLRVSKAPVTLSCVMDEDYAADLFKRDLGPLLARDALNAETILGGDVYNGFLASATWIERYFPRLYRRKVSPDSTSHPARRRGRPSLVNHFLFAAVGTFIRAKAAWHNRLLSTKGKDSALFEARLGRNHMIYESSRYRSLKRIYSGIDPIEPQQRRNTGPLYVP